MRIPVTEVRVGMIVMDPLQRRSEVIRRDSWHPPSDRQPWVQLLLRAPDGALTLHGIDPGQFIDVESDSRTDAHISN
jgi:hypothetical protein